jgi:subtilisin family serine protease
MFAQRIPRIQYVHHQLKSVAQESQRSLLALLERTAIQHRPFYIENAVWVKGADAKTLKQILELPEVEAIRPNVEAALGTVATVGPSEAVENGVPGHLVALGVDRVWREKGVKGKGIVIAGQDSGYYWEHRALKNQYRGQSRTGVDHNYNWHDAIPGSNSSAPLDDTGHGTHTMGTMVGYDGGTNQIGVAPEAKWIGCKNMKQGVGTLASYLECFEFFLAPYPLGGDPRRDGRPEFAPHIVNNSWTCPLKEGCSPEDLLPAVKAFKAAGIFVVAAASNKGPGCDSVSAPPSTYSGELLTVGAYNRYTQDIAFFSARGPSSWNGGLAPDLVTYGEIIRSSIHSGPDQYDDKAGTSMASPQVAGVVALLWSARPELIGQVEHTMDLLRRTARPLTSSQSCGGFPGSQVPNAVFGYGMVDAYAAIQAH